MKYFHFIIFIAIAANAHAQTLPQFAFPVDCELGKTCITASYVDVDPSAGHQDFKCNFKTYNDHKGTDFALKSRAAMKRGVNVLAAKDGEVLRVRDGEDDTVKTEEQYQDIRKNNKDCGNGILIDHGQGLQTFYCHLKQNSLTVKPGDKVKEGQAIAQVGQSGFSEFPHMHFSVIWEGGHIDPFTGYLKEDGCGKFKDNMWKDDLPYEPYAVFDGGFTTSVPNFADILQNGRDESISITTAAPALVYWIGFYHARAGDEITMLIKDPDGQIFKSRNITVEQNRKRPNFLYTGRKLNGKALKLGTYTATTTYKRGTMPEQTYTHTVVIK